MSGKTIQSNRKDIQSTEVRKVGGLQSVPNVVFNAVPLEQIFEFLQGNPSDIQSEK